MNGYAWQLINGVNIGVCVMAVAEGMTPFFLVGAALSALSSVLIFAREGVFS